MPSGDNKRKLSDADRAEIVRLYLELLPDGTWLGAPTIARQFGVRHPTIYRVLGLAGVPRRSARESHANGKRCKPISRLPVGDPPLCKCGCGRHTAWNTPKNRWRAYVGGHYTQSLDQNPAWRDGRSFVPYSLDWHEIARSIRKRDGYRCVRCGESFRTRSRALDVHHRNGAKLDNRSDNLVSLCRPCHAREHASLRGLRQGIASSAP